MPITPAASHDTTKHQSQIPWLEGHHQFKQLIPRSTQTFPVEIITSDETAMPVPAMLGIKYTHSWQWLVLEQPFLPNPRSDTQRSYRPQWKTKFPIHSNGRVQVYLPKGHYTLYAGKGLEYEPTKVNFEVTGDGTSPVKVQLARFVNLPQQGWWSGDTHVHAARMGAKDNIELLWAAQAEDIHLSSILLMGDPEYLHFPQYALGEKGTVREGDFWLVPGQEEPRTSELGHTIILNTQKLYRNTEDYYRYDKVFRRARKDGALTGIAHFFHDKFLSRNAGALLLSSDLVDFVELLDDTGLFRPDQYYDALNMGARLSLTAGSDYPWGGHIGDNRTYARLLAGEKFTPENWYAAVKSGRTFITQGPLLNFTINGAQIGDTINVKKGSMLKIEGHVLSHPDISAPKTLSLVSMGETLKTVTTERNTDTELTFTVHMQADSSRWFTAFAEGHKGSVAHSSPIYIQVDRAPVIAAAGKLRHLYEENVRRIQALKHAEFVPEPERDHFLQWLNATRDAYLEKISDLDSSSTLQASKR